MAGALRRRSDGQGGSCPHNSRAGSRESPASLPTCLARDKKDAAPEARVPLPLPGAHLLLSQRDARGTLIYVVATGVRAKLKLLAEDNVEAILTRAKERAVLAKRDEEVQLGDLQEAVDSFIDPLDPELLALQELAAVLACSDRRYLPEPYRQSDRAALMEQFARLKVLVRNR